MILEGDMVALMTQVSAMLTFYAFQSSSSELNLHHELFSMGLAS